MDDTIRIRYTDLIGWALIVICSLVSVLVILSHGRTTRACWGVVEPTVSAFLSTLCTFVVCFFATIYTTLETLLSELRLLPNAWYAMAALTILPMCVPIAQPAVIVYLACYCVTGLYICAFTAIPKKSAPIAAGVQTLKAHFLGELRITSVQ